MYENEKTCVPCVDAQPRATIVSMLKEMDEYLNDTNETLRGMEELLGIAPKTAEIGMDANNLPEHVHVLMTKVADINARIRTMKTVF